MSLFGIFGGSKKAKKTDSKSIEKPVTPREGWVPPFGEKIVTF